jgi:hypothetical protein
MLESFLIQGQNDRILLLTEFKLEWRQERLLFQQSRDLVGLSFKHFAFASIALLTLLAISCSDSSPTPQPESTAVPTSTPDIAATVAVNVDATIAAQASPTPVATPIVTAVPASPTPTSTPNVAPTSTPDTMTQVSNPDPVVPASVGSVALDPQAINLLEDEGIQVNAVVKDGPGNELTGRPLTWTSSNPQVAQVTSTGFVTAISAGLASITATADGVSGTASTTVEHGAVESGEIALGDGASLVAALRDANYKLTLHQEPSQLLASERPQLLQLQKVFPQTRICRSATSRLLL